MAERPAGPVGGEEPVGAAGRARPRPLARTCATPGCSAPRDRGLALRLVLLLPALAAGLKALRFFRLLAALERITARRVRRGARRAASPEHVAAVVVHVNRHVLPFQGRCLLESLALWLLLRRRGYAPDLVLGARTLLGPLEAHAWVELDGQVLNENARVREVYEPFSTRSATLDRGSA